MVINGSLRYNFVILGADLIFLLAVQDKCLDVIRVNAIWDRPLDGTVARGVLRDPARGLALATVGKQWARGGSALRGSS